MDGQGPEQSGQQPEGPRIPQQPGRERESLPTPPADNKSNATPDTGNISTDVGLNADDNKTGIEEDGGEGRPTLPGQLGKTETLDEQPVDTIGQAAREMPAASTSGEESVLGTPEPRGSEHDTTDGEENEGSLMDRDSSGDDGDNNIPTQQGGTTSGYQIVDPENPPDERIRGGSLIPGDRPPDKDKITPFVEEMPKQLESVPLGPDEPAKPGALKDPGAVLPQPRVPEDDINTGIDTAQKNLARLGEEMNKNVTASDNPKDEDGTETETDKLTTNEPAAAPTTDFAAELRNKLTGMTPGQGDDEGTHDNEPGEQSGQPTHDEAETPATEPPPPDPEDRTQRRGNLLAQLADFFGGGNKPSGDADKEEQTPPDTKAPEETKPQSPDSGDENNENNGQGQPPPSTT